MHTQVGGSDFLSFISYSDNVTVNMPLTAMTPAAKAFAHTTVEALCASEWCAF